MRSDINFRLEGQFAGFEAGSKSPFRYLRLTTETGEHRIKLSKELQLILFRYLAVNDRLRVVGRQKIDKHTGEPKLKAIDVVRIGDGSTAAETSGPASPVAAAGSTKAQIKTADDKVTAVRTKKKPARILVCNKSSCRKRGSEAVCSAIALTLSQSDRSDPVELKKTGCMDRCKAGPNMVVMPDKAKYTRVSPNQIPKLIDQHFDNEAPAVSES
ncbi:MAG: (2Fe-2S) ferredoxin domain-containing protein [Cyanobacteria bacterium J06626_23]